MPMQIKSKLQQISQLLNTAFETIKYRLGFVRHYILPREFYISPEILKAEYEHIFYGLWIFAGLTLELKTPKTWLRKKIGKKEILITQEDGNLFAIENVCPHKNVKFFDEDSGERPLVCRYHAWSFNPDGSNKRIPHEERSYKFGSLQKEMSCMTRYEIKTLGVFMFVKLSKNQVSIEKQFDSSIIKSLTLISKLLFPEYRTYFGEIRKFNWKMNFENLKDSLHPAVLHSTTLAREMDFSAQYEDSAPLYKMLKRISLSEASYFAKDGDPKGDKKGHLDDLLRPALGRGYYNWVLFPNFHMATPDGGRSYTIEIHNPVNPDKTEISHYVIVNKPYDDDALMDEILEHRLRGLRPVYEEDYGACEKIQEALEFTDREQNIGSYEFYNANIASMYRRLIGK
jgi:phenylpropionate dioxygenase-like ring-hydroxylating dioxygenase large terminal subunit